MVKEGVIGKVKFNRYLPLYISVIKLVLPILYRLFKQKYLYLIMNTNSNYPLEINIILIIIISNQKETTLT